MRSHLNHTSASPPNKDPNKDQRLLGFANTDSTRPSAACLCNLFSLFVFPFSTPPVCCLLLLSSKISLVVLLSSGDTWANEYCIVRPSILAILPPK